MRFGNHTKTKIKINDSDVNEEKNYLEAMSPGELCGLLDSLMGDKEVQPELTKV